MIVLALQIEHEGEWWSLARRPCHETDLRKARDDLMALLFQWEASRVFDPSARMRVEEQHRIN